MEAVVPTEVYVAQGRRSIHRYAHVFGLALAAFGMLNTVRNLDEPTSVGLGVATALVIGGAAYLWFRLLMAIFGATYARFAFPKIFAVPPDDLVGDEPKVFHDWVFVARRKEGRGYAHGILYLGPRRALFVPAKKFRGAMERFSFNVDPEDVDVGAWSRSWSERILCEPTEELRFGSDPAHVFLLPDGDAVRRRFVQLG